MSPEARASITLIFKEMEKNTMQRPGHWLELKKWVQNIHKKFSKSWEEMTFLEQSEFKLYALATGPTTNDVHFGYQELQHLIDVMFANSAAAALNILDDRSNPTTYMISAVAQERNLRNVKGDNYAGLQWPEDHDLDFNCRVMSGPYRGQVCDFRKKQIFGGDKGDKLGLVLDFDAGITSKSDGTLYAECITVHPCFENVELQFRVSLFSRRSPGTIPFQVIVSKHGEETIYENSFSPQDPSKSEIVICAVIFTKREEKEVTISEQRRRALVAQSPKFQALFANVNVTVATLLTELLTWIFMTESPYLV
jgi:hypothetical protein